MDKSCYRCGAAVKEGSAFCKNCGAPQIRVDSELKSGDSQDSPPTLRDSGARLSPDPQPYPEFSQGPPRLNSTPIRWGVALPGLLLAATIEAVFFLLGIGVLLGGFMSVYFYRRREPTQFVTTGMGARLGAVAGGLAFFIFSIVVTSGTLFLHSGNRLRDAMMASLQQAAARNPTPEAQQVLEYFRSPDGFAVLLAIFLVATLVIYLLLSMIGGIVAAGIAARRPRG